MESLAPGEPQAPSSEKLHNLLSECAQVKYLLYADLHEAIDRGTDNERRRVYNILQDIRAGRYPYIMVSQLKRYF